MQPALLDLRFTLIAGDSYIDIAQGLSVCNRRLYRQGMNYAVSHIEVRASAPGTLQFAVAGNTWVVHNAWKKMQRCWIEQQSNTRDEECGVGEGIKPRWEDFKVYLDDTQAGGSTLTPMDGDGAGVGNAAIGLGEWDYSKIVWNDDGTVREPFLHIIGGSTVASTVGLITEYERSRSYQSTNASNVLVPDGASDSIYARLHGSDDTYQEIIENMEDDNSSPPYDNDDYVGNTTNGDEPMLVGMTAIEIGTLQGAPVGGFLAQCGLVKVWNGTGANVDCILHLVPGNYKGCLAEPMGQ